jgi:hypothetical protein
MTERLTLAQHHLYTFQVCPRRFYLRFLARLPWPEAPLGAEQESAYERGRRFHRRVERHFLGLPVADETETDEVLRGWWAAFQNHGPKLPPGRSFVEAALTVPIGPDGHRLTGRFDLLIVGDSADAGGPTAALFDWKTGEPRPNERLHRAWQTRVYLIALAEGGAALAPDAPAAFAPDRLSLTYWYVTEPDAPRLIAYDTATHRRNLAEVEAIVGEIDRQLAGGEWPKTEDWTQCRHCAYRVYCGRQAAGVGQPDEVEDEEVDLFNAELEPQWG